MSLHNTVENMKKLAKISVVGGVTFLVLFIMFRFGVYVYGIINPPEVPPPDAKYGKLPSIEFGEPVLKDKFTYSVETISGELPTFPDRIKVYKIINKPTTLLNSKQANEKARAIDMRDAQGNYTPHKPLTPTQFQWVDTYSPLPRTLTMDINSFNFTLTSPYISYQPIIDNTYIADRNGAKAIIDKMLKNMGVLYGDIDRTKTTTELLSIKNGTLVEAVTLSSTQLIRVDLFQSDIEETSVYYPRYPHSTMQFLVTARSLDITDVVDAHFFHQAIKLPDPGSPEPEDSAEYPIKTATEAFAELEAGKGFISNYYGSAKNIAITDVKLGYFLSNKKQDYLMPVIVFLGNGEFYAFISAIRDEMIE